jgi:Domain of unknown function (DUF4190)
MQEDTPPPTPVYIVRQPFAECSIAAVVLSVLWVGGIASLAAIACGHLALRNIRRNDQLRGRDAALFGLLFGYAGVLITIVLVIMAHV